jgi:hypothetical protein
MSHLTQEQIEDLARDGHGGIGGYLTHDLEDAHREHAERGGYLLQIGDRPAIYAVCDESEAIEAWGRTPEHLAALTDYAEA